MQITTGYNCPGYWLDNKGSALTCNLEEPAPLLSSSRCTHPSVGEGDIQVDDDTGTSSNGLKRKDKWTIMERWNDRGTKNLFKNWNERCDGCRVRAAKQLSLLFGCVFVSASHSEISSSGDVSRDAPYNGAISVCLASSR